MAHFRPILLVLCLSILALGCETKNGAPATGDDAALDVEDVQDVALPDTATVEVNPYVGKCAKGPSICDDGNPCTVDDCDPALGCITAVKACADEDPCTLDHCDVKTGDCAHDVDPCDDGNACTTGSCTPGTGCVFGALDCNDNDACTSDGCTPSSGCLHAKLNCDDNLTCTIDSCDAQNGCVNQQPSGGKCCESDPDCDDQNLCTSEHCVAGLCQSQGIFGCCKSDADCNDANACTADTCDLGNGACSNTVSSGAGCCQTDTDCNDQKACTLDRCVANTCAHEVTCCQKASECEYYSNAADVCGDPTCTTAGCGVMPVAGAGCCSPSVKSTSFETSDAWDVKTAPSTFGGWSVATPAGTPAKTGTYALTYAAAKTTVLGGGKVAIAKMAPVHLPEGTKTTLAFAYITDMTGSSYVRLRAVSGLGSWVVWQATAVKPAWTAAVVDLSGFAGRTGAQTVTLQWEVVSSSLSNGTGPSASIDDVSITSTCKATTCGKDADCDDSLSATKDTCSNGQCVYVTASDYCETGAVCDDGNVCTADSCLPSKYQCNHGKVFNCCLDTAECDDKNVCTIDSCTFSHQCNHQTLPNTQCCNSVGDCDDGNLCTIDNCPTVGLPCAHTQPDANCCMAAKDCNDGEKCTVDTCLQNQCGHKDVCCVSNADCNDGDDVCTNDNCVNQFCEHTPTGAAGCCEPLLWQQDMESDIPAMWSVNASSGAVTWQWSQKKAHGGSGALWYGNAGTGNYDDAGNANTGSLQSTPINLPPKSQPVLSLWVWLDTETGPPYDELTVSVTVDGKSFVLWTKHQDKSPAGGDLWTMQNWYQVQANLAAFAGKQVVFTIKFDTVDGVANTGQGVFIDDVQLTRSCTPFTCAQASDCDDKNAATSDGCAAGFCTYAY